MSDVCLNVDKFEVREERFSRGPWPSQMGFVVRFIVETDESAKAFKEALKESASQEHSSVTLRDVNGRQIVIEEFHVNAAKGAIAEELDENDEKKTKRIVGEVWGKSVDIHEALKPGGLGMGW
jgi:hypothetical protein